MQYVETTSLEEFIPQMDVLYMTRIQRERFLDQNQYEKLKDSYVLTKQKINNAKSTLSILHPLPRVNEIAIDVDDDHRACYFKQALNGKYIRMALILFLLNNKSKNTNVQADANQALICDPNFTCKNPHCITTIERDLPQKFKITDAETNTLRCVYCEAKLN